jgi:hypothetical protein
VVESIHHFTRARCVVLPGGTPSRGLTDLPPHAPVVPGRGRSDTILHVRFPGESALLRPSLIACLIPPLFACAADLQRLPSAEPALAAGASARSIQLSSDVPVELHTGYTRTLKRDAKWRFVGSISQGEVFKPEGQVLTVEGAHVHEAYIVVAGGNLVGFYLPVEKAFVPLVPQRVLPFIK